MKRIFDLFLSGIGLLASLPLWLVVFLLILFDDGLPVIFTQERVGREGRPFLAYKFRTMKSQPKQNEGMPSAEDDERLTRSGRILRAIAMDELPQLINIFMGEMSFVGPRALMPVEVDDDGVARRIGEFKGFEERSKALPGLTGVAQVFARRDIPRGKKFQYDIWYIRNRSFALDIKLIILSFLVTFMGRWEVRNDKFRFIGKTLKERIDRESAANP